MRESAWGRRATVAVLVLGVLSASACGSSEEEGPTKRDDNRTRSVQVQPCRSEGQGLRHSPPEGSTYRAQLQGLAEPPDCVDGRWRFVLPSTDDPPMKRRTELWLTGEKEYGSGDDAVIDMRIRAELGEAAFSGDQWHVVWQLHGPTFGDWRGPALTLQVNNGWWVVAGGSGHPEQGSDDADYTWYAPLAKFSNGNTKQIRVEAHLTHNPEKARIDAWVDGEHVVRDHTPRSWDGLAPGTLYPGQDVVQARIGLYRGTLSGESPPRDEQVVEVWDPATR